MNLSTYFSHSYLEARSKFMAAAAGLAVTSHPHPKSGQDGETLTMDVALDGTADAPLLLIISSACHGVEGFCGSGIQIALLNNAEWRTAVRTANVAVLYIHGLNPYGFSWRRRTTHENVDLNRNFQDFSRPLPPNPGYEILHPLLIPSRWPPTVLNRLRLIAFGARHGIKKLQSAITGGQYTQPQGLFYGGRSATWSQQTLREVLRTHAKQCKRLALIDLHTGLGPCGVGERILACHGAAAEQRAHAWWGSNVTSSDDGSSVSAKVAGPIWTAIYEECAQAEYTGLVLEYGTLSSIQVLDALRADQWLENHPETPESIRLRIKNQMLNAFYIDNDEWKQQVVRQAQEVAWQAIAGLSA